MNHTHPTADCPGRDRWAAVRAGRVEPAVLAELAEHLDHCPSCQSTLDGLADPADELLSGLRDATPDPFEGEPECRAVLGRLHALIPDAAEPPPEAAHPTPEQLGEYHLLRLLGSGGMGAVYRAVHGRLGREVAVKVIPPGRAADPVALARFCRETAALGRLDHPNVVRATDAGEADGVTYLVMDLVDGVDLARLVRAGGPLPVADACEVGRQAAAGLQHLAAHGLVHREVKPSNLMLGRDGVVKLLDLGLVADGPVSGAALTGAGQVVGTFDYLAPEQADPGRRPDARTDVYGLGCTLFHLLTGRPPFDGPHPTTVRGKILAHAAAPIPDVRAARPDVPAGVAAVIQRMMAKDPADRFARPADAAAALAPFCTGSDLGLLLSLADTRLVAAVRPHLAETVPLPAARPRKRWRVVAAVAAVLLLAGGLTAAVRIWGGSPPPMVSAVAPAPTPTPGPDPAPAPPAEPKAVHPPQAPPAYPVAVLTFEERGAKDLGPKVTDLLFAKLSTQPDLVLVERTELKKVLDELTLNASGAVTPDDAARLGRLTGAKLLVTGSVVSIDKRLHLIAKVIGTETGRVVGASVEGAASDDLGALAGKLADQLTATIAKNAERLAPRPPPPADRIAGMKKKLGKGPRPPLLVRIGERHIGQPGVDPAAQTEVMRFAREAGFELIDADEGGKGKADVLITGEGFSEVAGRVGGLVSVRARVEVKAVDRRTGRVIAADRQTAVVVDLSEQVAGKTALQEAAAALAERVLPKLAAGEKK